MWFCPACSSLYRGETDVCRTDGTPLLPAERDPLIGRNLDRYRVQDRIGLGGSGAVYQVTETDSNERFAIKVLFGDLASDARILERFRREARSAAAIRHPNVVRVLRTITTPAGLTFLVMELLSGETLDVVLARSGPLPPRRVAAMTRQIALGLSAAHQLGFVHRDIKPSNVMVRATAALDEVKILDFGVVGRSEVEHDLKITQDGQFVGTPLYMAPEQARAPHQAAPATDLYALGVMLYEMLAGEPPFDAEGVAEVLRKHRLEPIPSLPDCDGLERLARWLLAKRPEERPDTAQRLIYELDQLHIGTASDETDWISRPRLGSEETVEMAIDELEEPER